VFARSGNTFSALAIVDGVVYSGTNAFDAATGNLLWATDSFGLSPAVSKSTVYRLGCCCEPAIT
jgi:hypothetical protein